MEIWSLSIGLTGYKSPISKSKVGVLGVSMSSIALVFIFVDFGNLVFLTFFFALL